MNNFRVNVNFVMIWNEVKEHSKMDLFKTHFKNKLIEYQLFDERKFEDYCFYFLKDSLTFNNETELRKYCEKMFNHYIEGILKI